MRLSSDLSQMTLNSMAWGNIRLDQIRSGVRRERDIVIPTNMSMMIAIMIDLNIVIINICGGWGESCHHSREQLELAATIAGAKRDLSSHLSSQQKRPI